LATDIESASFSHSIIRHVEPLSPLEVRLIISKALNKR
jgi:hypothetical protein